MEEEEAAAGPGGPRGEALGLVLQRLDWGDLVAASAVCWQWRREALQEALWTTHLNQVFARQLLEPYEAAASAADGAPAWPPPPPAGADPRALAGQLVEPPSLAEFRARHTRGLGCHGHGSRSKCAVAELFFHRVVKMLKSSSAELAPLVLRSINFGEAGEAACTKADLDHLEKLANERPCVEAVFLPEELWETADVQQNPVRLPALFRALYSYVNGQGWAHCAAVPLPDFLSLGTGFDSKVFASNRDLKGMVEAAWTEAGANRSASWGAQGPLGVNLAKPDLEVLRQVFDSESRAPGSGRTENLDENKNLYEDVLFLRLAEYSQIPGIRLCLEAGASTFRQPFLVMGNTKAMLETSKRAGACGFAQGLETDVGLLGGQRQTLGRGMDQWVNVHLLPLQLIPVVTRASLDFLLTGGTPGRGGMPFRVENGIDDVSPNHLLCFAASFVAAPKVLLVDTSTTFVYTVTTIGGPRPGPRLVRLGEFEVSTCGRRAGRSGGLTKKKALAERVREEARGRRLLLRAARGSVGDWRRTVSRSLPVPEPASGRRRGAAARHIARGRGDRPGRRAAAAHAALCPGTRDRTDDLPGHPAPPERRGAAGPRVGRAPRILPAHFAAVGHVRAPEDDGGFPRRPRGRRGAALLPARRRGRRRGRRRSVPAAPGRRRFVPLSLSDRLRGRDGRVVFLRRELHRPAGRRVRSGRPAIPHQFPGPAGGVLLLNHL